MTPGLRAKLQDHKPILAHLARLSWIESELAVWIDADTLVVDPTWHIPDWTHTFFGEECWVQPTSAGAWRAFQSPHNAFMGFTAASPVLGFLTYLSESFIERADAAHIAPQIVGPKLLRALNNPAQFTLVPEAGAVSPELLAEWLGEAGPAAGSVSGPPRRLSGRRATGPIVRFMPVLSHFERVVQAESVPQRHPLAENR